MISCYDFFLTRLIWWGERNPASIPFTAQASCTFLEVSGLGQMDLVHL